MQGASCRLCHQWGNHIASHCRMVKVMATLAKHSASSPAASPATHKSVASIPISQETKFLAPGHWQLAEFWQARPLQGIRNACRAPSVPTFAPEDTLAFCKCSATGTRTRVARVRAEYPNQLDYGGAVQLRICSTCECCRQAISPLHTFASLGQAYRQPLPHG